MLQRFILVLLFSLCNSWAAATTKSIDELDLNLWSKSTLLCIVALPNAGGDLAYESCPENEVCFPGEGRGDSEAATQCGDGDITLFSSLLCFGGIADGCQAVEGAQNTITGKWHRSPRLRAFPRLRTSNSFSPDMGLGVLLWVATDPTAARKKKLQWWIDWVGRNQRCLSEGCSTRTPRFCDDDDIDGDPEADYGCTFRPGDLATFGVLTKKWNIEVKDPNLRALFDRYEKDAVSLLASSAQLSKPGYSQHLVAVNLLIFRLAGIEDQSLDKAADLLAKLEPKNAFFLWLANIDQKEVSEAVLAACPDQIQEIPAKNIRNDWIWQREQAENPQTRSMIWDCRFMAQLLRK